MTDFDPDEYRTELEKYTTDQLIELCIGFRCELDALDQLRKDESNGAYETGCEKGYKEGYGQAQDEWN